MPIENKNCIQFGMSFAPCFHQRVGLDYLCAPPNTKESHVNTYLTVKTGKKMSSSTRLNYDNYFMFNLCTSLFFAEHNAPLWLLRVIFVFIRWLFVLFAILSYFTEWLLCGEKEHDNHKYEAAIYLMIILNDNATFFFVSRNSLSMVKRATFTACFIRCSGLLPLHLSFLSFRFGMVLRCI